MAKKPTTFLRFSHVSRQWTWALLLSLGALIVLALAVSQQGLFLDFRNRAAGACVTVSEGDCSPGCRWVPITKTVNCDSYSYKDCPSGCRKVSQEGPKTCKTVQKQVWVTCSASKHAGSDCDYNPATGKWTGGYYETSSVQECTQRPSTGNDGYCAGGIQTTKTGRCEPGISPTPLPGYGNALQFPKDCDKNPSILGPVTAGTPQTYAINDPAKAPCEVGHGATVYQLDCKGNKITKSVPGTPRDPVACTNVKQLHKDPDSCTNSGGCWVRSSITSSCIENGAEDSGYKCEAGKLTNLKTKLDTTPAKDKNDCAYQGGCWVPNHTCIRNGGYYKETGGESEASRRPLWCKDGLWKTSDPNLNPSPMPTPNGASPSRLCTLAMAWTCGTKQKACIVVDNDQEQCVSTANTSDTSVSDMLTKSCSAIQWLMCNYNADCGCQTPP